MDIFSTAVLARVVSELPQPEPFVFNSFFRREQSETSEDIHFDVDQGSRRLAPFVSPIVAGQVVRSKGFATQTFRPAYVKDKRVFTPNRALKRALGERIGGGLSPEQRQLAALAHELPDQLGTLARRQELMALESLRTGKVIVEGDSYPRVELDFGRDAGLTKTLTGNRWGQSGVKPLDNLQDWSLEVTEKSGAAANVVIMDAKSYKAFAADTQVQKQLDRFRGQDALNPTVVGEGARRMGSVGDLDIYVYAGWYEDSAGQIKPYLPEGTVIVTSPDLDGVRAYGAIHDEAAGYQAMPYFTKSWLEQDPSVRYLLMQSAPLPVPYRINASLGATVL